ncbi:amino acid ABC transporter permease [Actinomycetaceae bacterium MB13-C1-2]|nr:amino acid ABC transporter permease [Actinomycetaceae bacterium MB13-C1-2]
MVSEDRAVRPTPSQVELDRRTFRKKQDTRSILISIVSTLIFAAVLGFLVVGSPGWAVVQEKFFNFEIGAEFFPRILKGLWLNVRVLFFAVIGVAIFGSLLAVARTLKGSVFTPIRLLAAAYTDIFRGLPVILVLYLVGYGIPGLQILPRMPEAFWGTIALILCYSAYVSEVLRAGIEAIHPSQRMAARSLGLTYYQTLRMVVFPQAIRKVTPALMNDFVSMQKDVGLISVLGAVDAIRAAQIAAATTYNSTPYVVAGILFILFSWPFIRLTDWYTARTQKREQVGGLV